MVKKKHKTKKKDKSRKYRHVLINDITVNIATANLLKASDNINNAIWWNDPTYLTRTIALCDEVKKNLTKAVDTFEKKKGYVGSIMTNKVYETEESLI